MLAKTYEYLGLYYYINKNIDSSYTNFYRSFKTFDKIKDSTGIGTALMRMSIIEKNRGDYMGSEKNAIKSLRFLSPVNNKQVVASIYNNLGIVTKELKKFNIAIQYHKSALKLRNELDKKLLLNISSINNIAVTYKESGNNKLAIKYLDSLLKFTDPKTLQKKPLLKAMIIDNLAHSLFLDDSTNKNIYSLLNTSLSIRLSENDKDGIALSYIHFGDFYRKKESAKALEYYLKAKSLALNTKNYRDVLVSLKKLSTISLNPNRIKHLKTYFKLTDSLEIEKNKISDRFARIRFESDTKEKENKTLKTKQKIQLFEIKKQQTEKLYLAGGFLISISLLGIFIYYYQRNKKQKKQIENLQKELHHRVKNNLGIIDTFIEVAKEEFTDVHFQNKLTELQNRIASISQIHKQLYSNKNITHLNLNNYIKSLSNNIQNSFSKNNIIINQQINNNLQIDTSKSFAVGLIVNEFITNSFKYAFNNTSNGIIDISIKYDKSSYLILLKDNGKGLPNDFNLNEISTFGIRIMKLLTEQLNGTFKLTNNNGVSLKIQFSK